MKNILLSATALALILSVPAFAAPHDHGDRHDNGAQPATPAAPAAATPALIPGTPIVAPTPGGRSGRHGHDNTGGAGTHNNAAAPAPDNAHNDRHGGGANTFGGGDHRGGHTGRGHNNSIFDTFRRAFNAPRHYHYGNYHRPRGFYVHRWNYGEYLPSLFYSRNYWISDYEEFNLSNPPDGTVWVRYGNDALLVDEDNGEVIQVVYGIFY